MCLDGIQNMFVTFEFAKPCVLDCVSLDLLNICLESNQFVK